FQHLRERASPDVQERQRKRVDARVVVAPVLPRLFRPTLGTVEAVGPVGLAPERPFPAAGLIQELMPGDARVVGRLERGVVHVLARRVLEPDRGPRARGWSVPSHPRVRGSRVSERRRAPQRATRGKGRSGCESGALDSSRPPETAAILLPEPGFVVDLHDSMETNEKVPGAG